MDEKLKSFALPHCIWRSPVIIVWASYLLIMYKLVDMIIHGAKYWRNFQLTVLRIRGATMGNIWQGNFHTIQPNPKLTGYGQIKHEILFQLAMRLVACFVGCAAQARPKWGINIFALSFKIWTKSCGKRKLLCRFLNNEVHSDNECCWSNSVHAK